MVDKIWYRPKNVIAHFQADFSSGTPPKKAQELMAVTVAAIAMEIIDKVRYLVQAVDDSEESPDVRLLFSVPSEGGKAPECYQLDIEVVTYTTHSASQSLSDFVKSTKFAPTKGYDECTMVLVNIEHGTKIPQPMDWEASLKSTGRRNRVLVLGRLDATKPIHRLASVYPEFEGGIDFNAADLLSKQDDGVVRWTLGAKAATVYESTEKHCPFEKLGVKCTLI